MESKLSPRPQDAAHDVEQMILGLAVTQTKGGGRFGIGLDVGDAVGRSANENLASELRSLCGDRRQHGTEHEEDRHHGGASVNHHL